jgi:hypothetical protein
MKRPPPSLPAREALEVLARWRRDAAQPVSCPLCPTGVLSITDHSARPHAEWYRISCRACGLDQNLHIPLRAPSLDPD